MNITPLRSLPRRSHHHARAAVLGSLALLALAACQSEELPVQDLGNTSDQLSVDEPEAPAYAQPFVGRWVGEAQDIFATEADGTVPTYAFPSGASRIVLEVSTNEYGDFIASISFGDGSLPPPQAGVAYPPGFDAWASSVATFSVYAPPFEGFEYRVYQVEQRTQGTDPNLITLSFNRHQPYEQWCPLQPSLSLGGGNYNCVGGDGLTGGNPPDEPCTTFSPEDGSEYPVDCNVAILCMPAGIGVCTCDARGCNAASIADTPVYLRRSGDQLLASIGTAFETSVPGSFLPLGLIRFRHVAD